MVEGVARESAEDKAEQGRAGGSAFQIVFLSRCDSPTGTADGGSMDPIELLVVLLVIWVVVVPLVAMISAQRAATEWRKLAISSARWKSNSLS